MSQEHEDEERAARAEVLRAEAVLAEAQAKYAQLRGARAEAQEKELEANAVEASRVLGFECCAHLKEGAIEEVHEGSPSILICSGLGPWSWQLAVSDSKSLGSRKVSWFFRDRGEASTFPAALAALRRALDKGQDAQARWTAAQEQIGEWLSDAGDSTPSTLPEGP